MIEMIASQAVWFWLCFGGILLILEMLGTGGYLLWSGVAALVVALLVWIMRAQSRVAGYYLRGDDGDLCGVVA